jgi:phosphatidylserine/phosphatidylglycerophosphate/cardiolipin synthase-like enzyme
MTVLAALYANGDDCFLTWHMAHDENCLGFAITKEVTHPDGRNAKFVIDNRTGFEGDDNPPHSKQPSSVWPFQRYTWTDHGISEGDVVSYSIAPVVSRNGQLSVDRTREATVGPATATASAGRAHAYFNRGIILSQFVARELGTGWEKDDLKTLKSRLAQKEDKLRDFLTGYLGGRIVQALDEAAEGGGQVYAALYELQDDELIDKLKRLGQRAHLILSNGSTKKRGEDGNARARETLKGNIDLYDRMLWSKGLGHNKFVVFTDSAGAPQQVWTGSMNWASTGMCTQVNNGILLDDPVLAQAYLDHWKLLRDDSAPYFGGALLDSNDEPKTGHSEGLGNWTIWFTRTRESQDLDFVSELINGAREALLFLMFEPGKTGLFQVIQARLSPASPHYNEQLYVQGVVNTRQGRSENGHQPAEVDLIGRGRAQRFDLSIVQPEGVAEGLAGWAAEVTREDFILTQGGVIGHAIIHSKTIVLDPFTNPVVITGSHNFSASASTKNDENLVIIKDNPELAQRYAVNIMSVYQHYRWRAYLQECARRGISPWGGLKRSAEWQNLGEERRAELSFWLQQPI